MAGSSFGPAFEYDRLVALGVAHRGLDNPAGAEMTYDRAIALAPGRPEARAAKAALHAQLARRRATPSTAPVPR